MSRTPNARHKPNLEDILNRGRDPVPHTWRHRLADWWSDIDWASVSLFVVVCLAIAAVGLSLLMAFVTVANSPDKGQCLSSHSRTIMMPVMVGKSTIIQPRVMNVCDLWEYPEGKS